MVVVFSENLKYYFKIDKNFKYKYRDVLNLDVNKFFI